MATFMNLTGQRFGRLTVQGISAHRGARGQVHWDCVCMCGNTRSVQASNLRSGHCVSCGCLNREVLKAISTTHGGSGTRLFRVWLSMKNRCYRPKTHTYCYYGGRGIRVCSTWRESFAEFRTWATQNGYAVGLTIDRIDNDGNYEPSNCRWITLSENVRRARQSKFRKAGMGQTNTS